MRWRLQIALVAIFAFIFIAGCAAPTRATDQFYAGSSHWQGRLSVRIESDPPQAFSAGFELRGSPQVGELIFYTPLGSTAAALSWSSGTAVMRTPSDVRYFESLDALTAQAIGTSLPVAALFAWLAGTDAVAAGWSADLSQRTDGRFTARRTEPRPLAELRVVLEK